MNPLLLLAAAAAAYALLMKDDKPSKPSGPTIPVPGGGSVPSPIVEPVVLDRDCFDENIPDELRIEVTRVLATAPTDANLLNRLAMQLRMGGYNKIADCLEKLASERGAA